MKFLMFTLALTLALFFSFSCQKPEAEPINTNPNAFPIDTLVSNYIFNIENTSGEGTDKKLIAGDVNSSWFPETGLIYLGADDNNEPLGTLTMYIDPTVHENDDGEYWVNIMSATLSTSDVRVGTAQEINARIYKRDLTDDDAKVYIFYINDNLVAGNMKYPMFMNRVIVNANTTPETIEVGGFFVCRNQ